MALDPSLRYVGCTPRKTQPTHSYFLTEVTFAHLKCFVRFSVELRLSSDSPKSAVLLVCGKIGGDQKDCGNWGGEWCPQCMRKHSVPEMARSRDVGVHSLSVAES